MNLKFSPSAFLGSRRQCYAFNIIYSTIITLVGRSIGSGQIKVPKGSATAARLP